MRGARGGGSGGQKNSFVLAILVRIPVKSSSYQDTVLCMANIGTPAKRHFKWRFAGGPRMDRLWPTYSDIWSLSPLINLKNVKV